ncbi:hypothetical protein [Amycolatopsis anabasis]|uniref:hypothetical protein n=1 Tax=Amycolatopsis anabasis TaxID=1840409 RepID=UPI00131E350A|nr:hypothetical protein [Amycolatopsis anabasis]
MTGNVVHDGGKRHADRSGQVEGQHAAGVGRQIRAELADVLRHVLLMARHGGVDLKEQVERKWLVWHPDKSVPAVAEPVGPADPRQDLAVGSEATAETTGLLMTERTGSPGENDEEAAKMADAIDQLVDLGLVTVELDDEPEG